MALPDHHEVMAISAVGAGAHYCSRTWDCFEEMLMEPRLVLEICRADAYLYSSEPGGEN